MSSSSETTARSVTAAGGRVTYWAVMGLFVVIFGSSALWNIVDPAGARVDYLAHGYPAYVVYPVAVAKLAGIAVILLGRWRTLAGLAFAGFFYDLVLALGAHVAEGEAARGALALFTMVITILAWRMWRRRSGPAVAVEARPS